MERASAADGRDGRQSACDDQDGPVQPEPLTRSEAVYRKIRHDMLSGVLMPGQRLALSTLREHYDVSFGVVREALFRLVGERLVRATPQHGFRVNALSTAELEDMIGVYRTLEVMALERAFTLGDVAWEAKVLAAGHTLARTPMHDPAEPVVVSRAFANARAAFRAALLAACDSPCLLNLCQSLYDALTAQRRSCTGTAAWRAEVAIRYQAVTKAALARDVDLAVRLLAQCDAYDGRPR